jgi:hypothetical protein
VRRFLTQPLSVDPGKCCAVALLLILPGSFIALPVIWLVRRWRLSAGG